MQDLIPTRPADQARTSLRDQLVCHESHLAPPVNTRLHIGEPAPVGRLRADALAALVCGQALADQLRRFHTAEELWTELQAAGLADVAVFGIEVRRGRRWMRPG